MRRRQSEIGVPGWVSLDLALDSNDLTRLNGCDGREVRGRMASLHLAKGIPGRLSLPTHVPSNQLDHRRRALVLVVLPVSQFNCRDNVYDQARQSTIYAQGRTSAGRE